jgi:hypothetical protein
VKVACARWQLALVTQKSVERADERGVAASAGAANDGSGGGDADERRERDEQMEPLTLTRH